MKFAFIAEVAEENERRPRNERFPVTFMCEMLEVTPGGYYAWKDLGYPLEEVPPPAMAAGERTLTAEDLA